MKYYGYGLENYAHKRAKLKAAWMLRRCYPWYQRKLSEAKLRYHDTYRHEYDAIMGYR